MKISLITVCYNAGTTIERCIASVLAQSFKEVEYIIIDGKSTDNTVQTIQIFKNFIHRFISEPDQGIYDGMNKGINLASGDIIGMLNADDFFAHNEVLSRVAEAFEDQNLQLLYGDLDFVNSSGTVFRKWRSGKYKPNVFNFGWMPPHPTFYCRRELFKAHGVYRLDLGTSADYELMLRFIHTNKINSFYLKSVMVNMEAGGASNRNLRSRILALQNDWKAMKSNGIAFPILAVLLKRVRKIGQYL
ncbi:glycosyltransferase family 2 protein [Mucilaginibacter flavus]|uniref:glycosyltransferase family 2 protein n=1 Tax=Mucilaginibacter flavus TaxID=931504 RepID=UPI0025B519CD|nr:glycosyltransferase family 2 protein [Mucilaginibacter flavus]MDN3584394.1 glycosyltransferase family 2 protein [Mucilaginibacter flavus]